MKNFDLKLIESITKIKPTPKPINMIKGFLNCDDIEDEIEEDDEAYDEDDIITGFKFGKT